MTPKGAYILCSVKKVKATPRKNKAMKGGSQNRVTERKRSTSSWSCLLGPCCVDRRCVFVQFSQCEKCPSCLSGRKIIITETTFLTPQL